MQEVLFYIVIVLANIIQGITGFAGTILAMPFSIMLVGGAVARPVLNVLGFLSGIYVFAEKRSAVNWKEFGRIVCIMTVGIVTGMYIRSILMEQEHILYGILGVFVIGLAVHGLCRLLLPQLKMRKKMSAGTDCAVGSGADTGREEASGGFGQLLGDVALLGAAGIAHGMFVCGGPLLIGYLTRRIADKTSFRATISTVWIVLNGIILVTDSIGGCWNGELLRIQLLAVPFLLVGMFIGSRLYRIMSQRTFMMITYVLLLISGVSLLIK